MCVHVRCAFFLRFVNYSRVSLDAMASGPASKPKIMIIYGNEVGRRLFRMKLFWLNGIYVFCRFSHAVAKTPTARSRPFFSLVQPSWHTHGRNTKWRWPGTCARIDEAHILRRIAQNYYYCIKRDRIYVNNMNLIGISLANWLSFLFSVHRNVDEEGLLSVCGVSRYGSAGWRTATHGTHYTVSWSSLVDTHFWLDSNTGDEARVRREWML